MPTDSQKDVVVKIQGGTITFWEHLDEQQLESRKQNLRIANASRDPDREKIPLDRLPPEAVWRKRNATITALLHELETIKSEFRVFLSLSLDHKYHPHISADDFKAGLAKFFSKLREEFVCPWGIYKIECTHAAGFHLHFVGQLWHDTITAACLHTKRQGFIKALWDASFGQEKSRKRTVQLGYYVEEHRGYLTTKKKFTDDILCMKRLRGRKMWGVIGKEWIDYEESAIGRMSRRELLKIIDDLTEAHEETHDTEYFERQAKHKNGGIRGLDRPAMAALQAQLSPSTTAARPQKALKKGGRHV